MTDETPTPVDPARVHAVLEVLGWPDDRKANVADQEPLDAADLPFVHLYWDLAEDIIRAADAASSERHVIEIQPDGWTIQHPLTCRPNLFTCPANTLAQGFDGPPAPPGRYECEVNDLGDRLLILDRVDLPEAPDA